MSSFVLIMRYECTVYSIRIFFGVSCSVQWNTRHREFVSQRRCPRSVFRGHINRLNILEGICQVELDPLEFDPQERTGFDRAVVP